MKTDVSHLSEGEDGSYYREPTGYGYLMGQLTVLEADIQMMRLAPSLEQLGFVLSARRRLDKLLLGWLRADFPDLFDRHIMGKPE